MNADVLNDQILRRYLLGSLTAEIQECVEQRLFSDDRIFWEYLGLIEEELIDDYVHHELDPEEAGQFERHFLLTDERRVKLEFARALSRHAASGPAARRASVLWWQRPVPAPAWALAAAAALILFVLPAVMWRYAAPGPRGDVGAWLASSAGQVRGAGGSTARVVLPANCQVVRLHVDPGAERYPSYRATLHQVTEEEIWSQSKLAVASVDGRPSITLTLPCELLPDGDYHLRLEGERPGADPVLLDRFDFRILHQ